MRGCTTCAEAAGRNNWEVALCCPWKVTENSRCAWGPKENQYYSSLQKVQEGWDEKLQASQPHLHSRHWNNMFWMPSPSKWRRRRLSAVVNMYLMISRGPFQPLQFCRSVISGTIWSSIKIDFIRFQAAIKRMVWKISTRQYDPHAKLYPIGQVTFL